jgi:hypothetical protein
MDVAKVTDMLRAALAELGGGPVATPAGFVAVAPTGPQGSGKVRFWPSMAPGEMAWGYADRCSKTINPDTHFPFYASGRETIIGSAQAKWGGTIPETLDRLTYPYEWMTQEELDTAAALAARDAAEGNRFSPV